jgi:8-oxo-dGTP pyrophosphatase MutT (NUDIX family)
MFPKGIVEQHETHAAAALKEAWEEAGIQGRIVSESLGKYQRRKWGTTTVVSCFLMHVDRQHERWPEAAQRRREWVPLDNVAKRLDQDDLRSVAEAAMALLQRRRSEAG